MLHILQGSFDVLEKMEGGGCEKLFDVITSSWLYTATGQPLLLQYIVNGGCAVEVTTSLMSQAHIIH
jgi:hypothetical protein